MYQKKYLIALDQGTTSSRAILFDRAGQAVASAQKELAQHYPQPGWVEEDAMELYATQYGVLMELLAISAVRPEEIAAIGITNQRETTILWDRETGKPVYNAIVWQCRRTAAYCEELKSGPLAEEIRRTTGLVVDAYFSATKIRWILDHVPEAARLAREGRLLFGTVDTWLIWKLTGGRVHATDYTNASRTMLFDVEKLQWDEGLCRQLGIPMEILPQVRPSSGEFGTALVQGVQIPITGVAGDQQAALYGQCCFESGMAKNTYGTGCFLLMNTGEKLCRSSCGLITTIAASAGGRVQYALEGSVFVAGALIQWLRDEMRFITEAADTEYFARRVPDNGGVYVVPAFTGMGAPYWDMYARGTISGLTRGTTRNHIIRASLEAIAYQVRDILAAMVEDTGAPLQQLRVDGGASANDFLMQFQADLLDCTLIRPLNRETTAQGAAFLAGLAVGFWRDEEELRGLVQVEKTFCPAMGEEERQRLLAGWNRAVGRTLERP